MRGSVAPIVLCCALFGSNSAVRAAAPTSDTPVGAVDALSIRAKVEAAKGPLPTRERVVASTVRNGVAGTHESLTDGPDSAETDVSGPFTTRSGRWHGERWHQNANGETVVDAPDPGNASVERFATRVSHVASPTEAYVFSHTNAEGRGSKEYIDPQTWHVVRVEQIAAATTTVTTYDDFRMTDGRTRAWHVVTEDGTASDREEDRITSVSSAPIDPARFQEPPGRPFVTFPTGSTRVPLPVSLHRGKFVVRVTIAGRGLDFYLDTGAAGITIDDDVARSLKLPIFSRATSTANAGRYVSTRTIAPRIDVGPLEMHDVAMSTIPHLHADDDGTFRAVGLLGFDFIADLALELDYEHGTATAIDAGAFTPPADPRAIALPIRLGAEQPFVDVTVNGALGERFILDTGAAYGVTIFDYFRRRHPEAIRDEGMGKRLPPMRMFGVGGEIAMTPYQLASVKIGNVDFKDFTALVVTDRKAYGVAEDGLIGAGFFEDFTLYTDYRNAIIYLVPNANGRRVLHPST